ncbi:5'-adenylylsulfate reductase-like 3 [Ananas comosus]|uniref:5'-adenylylsulfate reductase-like 3 n=1 Tax=Ananas comosus TaxID=4615 RepID=A0A199UZT5_ANACO|nr:5'-adenylylsulfate reductase-like 3 [Ananas comosus]
MRLLCKRAVNLVHWNREIMWPVLFYASWCPFSKICMPNFQSLSLLFPSIRHFAFEESVIRPSILSRYGVHGFPTLFLLNSTMRVRYHGARTINSLVAFYNDVTGINPALSHSMPVERIEDLLTGDEVKEDIVQENCPFSWARSPEKLLQQDTYLALAICFVLLRVLYFLLPKLKTALKRIWRRHTRFASLMNLGHYFEARMEQAKQVFGRLNPCKRSNLRNGAMNATKWAWASKSLASVSIGEPSSGRASASERR